MQGISCVVGKIEKLRKEEDIKGSDGYVETSKDYYFNVSGVSFVIKNNKIPHMLNEGDDVKIFYQSNQTRDDLNHTYFHFNGIVNYTEKMTHFESVFNGGIVFPILLSIIMWPAWDIRFFDEFIGVVVIGSFTAAILFMYYVTGKELLRYNEIKLIDDYIKEEMKKEALTWEHETNSI